MPEIPSQNYNCDTEGVTPTITGIMGTLQANEVLNSILGFKSNMEKKMIIFNSIQMSLRKVNLSKNKIVKINVKIYFDILFFFSSLYLQVMIIF